MVIDINDTLLESIKKELLDTLRAAEVRVVDMFEFGETHGSDETLNDLHSVKTTLQMIGEPGAAALCESIRLAIVDAIENDDIEEHEGLADSFLTLSQYVERLSVDSSHAETVTREQQLLANAQNALTAGKAGSDGITASDKVYPLNDKQKKIVASAVNALSKLESANDNVFWQGIYKTAKVVKGEVNTQESHELIWLIEQAAILNVKGDLSTKPEERGRIFSAYQNYLQTILNGGETLAGYQQPVIGDVVTLLKQMSSAHEVLHNDYRPPVQKLQVAESSGLSLSVVFPVSAETIETIAFLVKKELATTKQLFEQAIANGDPLTDVAKTALLDSLKLPKATFHLLNFTSGKALIEEAEELLRSGESFDTWQANFAEDLILVEDALWQLDYLERTGIVNPYDAATHQKLHTKNMAAEAAKIIVAESAYEFFKSSRENLIENFDTTDQIDLVAGAKEIHHTRSSTILLGEEELAEQLAKAEQLQLFLINKSELLEDSLHANFYMDVLVGYEIIFEQLQTSLTVDQRALKILTGAQNQLAATAHFNPEQMADIDYLQKSTSNDEVSTELEQEDITDGNFGPEADSTADELELEPLDVNDEDESLAADTVDVSATQPEWSTAGMSPAFANITQKAVPDESVESAPASELDDDILDIFLEEGHGIAKQLEADVTELAGNYYNDALIGEIRRAFHTLKGSGRMVGLNVFGEFAWQHEELLNKVVGGEITLNDTTQELFVNAQALVEKTVNSEPFAEDREALLLAAAQAKTLREMLLSGEPLPTAPVEAQQAGDSPTGDGLSLADLDTEGLTTAGLSAKGGASVASLLSEADLEAVADKLSDRAAQKEQQAQETLQQVSSHPALSATAEIANAQDAKVQKIAQTADLIGGLGDDIVHEDLAAVFHALSQIDRSEFDDSRQHLAQQLDKVAELSRENLGNKLEQSQIKDVAQAIKSLQGSATETDIVNSEAALSQLESAWAASKEEGLTLDFNIEEDVSWAFGYIDANAKLFDAWRKDDFTKQRAFNGLRQNMIGFERLLLNNHIQNPIAVTTKVRELLDTISALNLAKISDEAITNAAKHGIEEIRDVLEALQNGERDAIASTDVLADIEHAISTLQEQSVRLASPAAGHSSDAPIEFDWSLSEDYAAQAIGTNTSSEVATSEMSTDDVDSMAVPKMPVQLPPQAIASGYLGQAGSLSENINAVKAQFLPVNLAKGDFQHSQLIDSIYDVEASLDSQDAPAWTWEALSNLESVVSSMHDKSLLPSPADYDRITKALEAIQNSDDVDAKLAKNVNNSLMGLRAELTARRETAAVAKQFADAAHDELEATDQSFDEWKGSGFTPQNALSDLIDNMGGVTEQSRAVEYDDAEELSSLVNTVLNRLKEENVVPFEEISDIVGEAVTEITTVSSQFHGDSLASPELKESLEQQGIITPVGVEYVPLNNIDELRDISPVSPSEVTDVVTKGVDITNDSQSSQYNLGQDVETVELTNSEEKINEGLVDNVSSHTTGTEVTETAAVDSHIDDVASDGIDSNINSTAAGGQPLGFDDSPMTEAQKQSFVQQTDKHIKASRKQFDRWEKTGFTDDARLERLSKNVDSISQLSEAHNFQSAQNLSSFVGEVLARIYDEAVVPDKQTTASVSDAIDEFGRTHDAIRRKDKRPGKQSVDSDLLAKMRSIASMASLGTPATANTDEHAELVAERQSRRALGEGRLQAPAVSDGYTKASENAGYQETDYQSYIEEVRLAIEDSQDSFDNWQASKFEDEEELETLTENVKEITETSEKHRFDSGADLGKSIEDVLSQIAESGDSPTEEEVQQVEAAVNEFSRSARAIQSGQGDKEIRETVIDNVKQVIHKTESVGSGQSETINQQGNQSANYQGYVDDVRSAINDSQDSFNNWKASDFENHQDLNNLSSSVKDITEASEKHGFDSGTDLGKSIDDVLSQLTESGDRPTAEEAQQVEAAVNEFSRSADAIQSGHDDKDIRESVIHNVKRVIQQANSVINNDVGASSQSVASSIQYHEYVDDVLSAIESSQDSFNNWKASDFESHQDLDSLSGSVKEITETSEKHGFDSGTDLGKSIEEVLSQIAESGDKPTEEEAQQVEAAVNEFSRSADAIQSDHDDKDIRESVIYNVKRVIQQTETVSSDGAPALERGDGAEIGNTTQTVQYKEYVDDVRSTIESSKEHFDGWRASDFFPGQSLDNLSDDVKEISQSSEKHRFDSANSLANSVDEVLTQVSVSGEQANTEEVEQVEAAVNELSRSAKAIDDNNHHEQEIREEVIHSVKKVVRKKTQVSIEEIEETEPADVAREATDEIVEETNYKDYISDAKPAIEKSKEHFDDWKASDFEPNEQLEHLSGSVRNITAAAKEHGFDSAEALGGSVDSILTQTAVDQVVPEKETTDHVGAAVDEFSRSAHAIESGEGDKAIQGSVLENVSRTAEKVVDASVGVPTEDKSLSAGESRAVDYKAYASSAKPAIDNSKTNFEDWKANDFIPNTGLDNLSNNVETITETSQEHGFDSGAALGKSVGSILSEAAKEETAPEKEATDEVEAGLNEFARSATAIETGQGQPEISSSAISSAGLVAEKMVAGSSAQVTAGLTDELADTAVQATAYVAYAKEAMPVIENSKNSFDDWKNTEFELNDEFDKFSDNVKDISAASQKHGVESATELANSVSEILSQVMVDGVTPNHATTESIESAIDEFARSAQAIQDDNGVQEVRQEVIANIQGLINRTASQPMVANSAATHSLFNESQPVTTLATSETVNVGEDASSLAAQLANKPTSDFEQVVNQSAEQSDAVTDKKPTANAANDYEGLKYNDPNILDETILDIFLNEAKELVIQNNTSAADWKADHDDLSALQSIQRGLHTLKGGARMAELTVLGDLSHNIEALLDAIVDGQIADKDGAHGVLQSGLNLTSEMVTLADSQQVIVESPEYYEMLNTFLREQTSKGLELPAPKRQIVEKENLGDEDDNQNLVPHQPVPVEKNRKSQQRRSYMMRVSSDLIDKLTGLIGEDVISRSRIERQLLEHGFQIDELSRTVNRVSEQLRRLENETEAQILFRHDAIDESAEEDFDPLELDRFSEIQQLSRLLAESMHDLESIRGTLTEFVDGTRQILLDQNNIQRELQDGVLSASLVRFDSVAPRFERMVEQVADELGKEVMVQIYGGHNDIERNMLEDLIPGFEHTIRNSLAHGIETPEKREKAGKPRQGRIRIAVRREGAEIGFMIADDGRGANLDAIRDKARRLNMLDESKADDKNYLLQLLFEPGFSTQEQATQISGRGIGMDVLRDVINAHQGNIDVESEIGKGMATFIRLPFAMSITEALSVQIGRYQYAVPVMSIEGIARIPHEDYEVFESGQPTFHTYGQNRYKVESLIQFIDPYAERIFHPQGVPVLLVRVGSKRLALEVEEIGSRQEVIIKSVNPQFTSLPGIIGATVLDNGMPVPVMEATTLGRHFLNFTQIGTDVKDVINPEVLEATDVQPKVLVVDDSITMRKVTTKILGRYDVEYQTAKDGLDAIDVISEWTPDVILLDIEMPRMDGFEFATHIRNDSAIKNVPIIMITSRTGSKHRERAEGIGVNDYLGKPYTEETLIASLETILNKKLHK